MAFVRKKTSHGRSAFYLVENHRVGGKVRQRVLCYLGPTEAFVPCNSVEGAIGHWEREAALSRNRALTYEAEAKELEGANGGPLPHPPSWARRTSRYKRAWSYWAAVRKSKQLRKRMERIERRLAVLRRFQGIDVGETQPGVA